MSNMQIREALKHRAGHVDALDRELLLAHILKKNREYLIAHENEQIPFGSYFLYRLKLRKRKKGVPLAYILGSKEFFGYHFLVNKHTLVPRPDTELLVQEAIDLARHEDGHLEIIDIGTGTGCIPISIFKTTGTQNGRITYTASDVSGEALEVACKNADLLNAAIKFRTGSLLEPYDFADYQNRTIIITANLPYLTHEQFIEEKSIQHEPYYALVASENGLALYKQLLEQLTKKAGPTTALEPRPRVQGGDNRAGQEKIILLCEIDPNQTIEFKKIVERYFPNASVEIKKDLANLDRLAIIRF